MTKLTLTSFVAVLFVLGMSSCRKCEICTQNMAPEIRICEGDYNTNVEYALALDALELVGYKCR